MKFDDGGIDFVYSPHSSRSTGPGAQAPPVLAIGDLPNALIAHIVAISRLVPFDYMELLFIFRIGNLRHGQMSGRQAAGK
ncbi:hypothetical protein [Burkholderia anthina]|uniref:hypothetical protein n=1 Tax=Burkholderia anthina TaxID=179879 RepID=UPI0037C0281F